MSGQTSVSSSNGGLAAGCCPGIRCSARVSFCLSR